MESVGAGLETLRVEAPKIYSAEINRLLGQNEIFAAELHPYEGSLEDVYLQLTTPSMGIGEHLGMAGLAGGAEALALDEHQNLVEEDIAGLSSQGKRGNL